MPELPGAFDGTIRHSVAYKSAEEFRGKRVLVVGGGNSGADIACDAALTADHAAISLRRGYHVIPKHILGKPADVFARDSPKLPFRLRQRIFGFLLRRLVGDTEKLGLPKPDHRILESHPLVNDQMLHHLRHGDLTALPGIARLDGDGVVFADGRRENFDEIVLATGYSWETPYLDGLDPLEHGRRRLPL
jgi:cation diffusion facilitator CzcD-associated flavoprotein CzcO